jgi:quercetin dioxygenase-like cupin family protein
MIRHTRIPRPRIALIACALVATSFLAASAVGPRSASAAEKAGAAEVQTLLTQDLPGIPGKEALMLTVTYVPGGASLPHRHDAEVFVYVLEGSVVMQIDGHPPQTLGPGKTFHEGPSDVHRQSANASAAQPAKLLVFVVKDKGKPVTLPVATSAPAH